MTIIKNDSLIDREEKKKIPEEKSLSFLSDFFKTQIRTFTSPVMKFHGNAAVGSPLRAKRKELKRESCGPATISLTRLPLTSIIFSHPKIFDL